MSAVEALAEVLLDAILEPYAVPCPTCGAAIWQSCSNDAVHGDSHATREVDALVAAIRSMPAEQVAELIAYQMNSGGWRCDHGPSVERVDTRAVGPWPPLGVSPETNGEQK